MRNFIKQYKVHGCFSLLGFYIAAVFLAYVDSESKDFILYLNSLGVFLASAGAVAALLTLFHVVFSRIEDKEEQEVNYFKYMMFILNRQAMFISLYEEKISSFKNTDKVSRALHLGSITFDETLVDAIDIERSIFLLSSPNEDLLSELDRCQRDFKSLSHTVIRRNNLYINDYQRKIQHKLNPNNLFSLNELEEIVGSALVPSLVEFTNEMYRQLPKVRIHVTDVYEQLNKELTRKYPNRKFIERK